MQFRMFGQVLPGEPVIETKPKDAVESPPPPPITPPITQVHDWLCPICFDPSCPLGRSYR